MSDPQQRFDDFWKELVCDDAGYFIPEAVKNELYDYYDMIHALGLVYDHATGGAVSKPNTDPQVVMNLVDEHVADIIIDNMQDAYDMILGASDVAEALKLIQDHWDVTGI